MIRIMATPSVTTGAVWRLLLLLIYGALVESCPVSLSIEVIQLSLATRPHGDVTLKCKFTGVPSNYVKFYWWLRHETNTPIYTFSEDHGIDEITSDLRLRIKNETHQLSDDGIISFLYLEASITDSMKYRCEFTMKDNAICAKTTAVQFEDPQISIYFTEEPMHNDIKSLTDLYCGINAAAGETQFKVGYEGPAAQVVEMLHETDLPTESSYAHLHNAIMRLPPTGNITCAVTDALGTYHATRAITGRERVMIGPNASPVTTTQSRSHITSVLLAAAVVVITIHTIVILPWRRIRHWLSRRHYKEVPQRDEDTMELDFAKTEC